MVNKDSLINNIKKDFIPKFFIILFKEGITKEQLIKDIFAGIITGIVAIPLAIAFAIASGVSPEKGLITAFIAGFIISFLGGSRVQIGGPTGAFVVIIYDIILKYEINGLIFATFCAGILLIIFGLIKLGNLLRYFPFTIIVGFTTGIAVIIFASQVKDFLGLNINEIPSDFIDKWIVYFNNLNTINYRAVIIGTLSILIVVLTPKITKIIPGSLLAIIITTLIVKFFNLPVETIGTRYGDIKAGSFSLQFIKIDFGKIKYLISPIISISLLGAIESLLSATVADGMIGGKHKPNIELVAQGIANCFSAIFGGIPATGAIARTSTNVKNGGRTPVAGMTHAILLLIVYLFAFKYVKLIPMATLAGILIFVAYNMSEIHLFFDMMKINKADTIVLLITFFLTVIFDLVIAIEVGMIFASFLFIKNVIDSSNINISNIIDINNEDEEKIIDLSNKWALKNTIIYEIIGPFFFGQAQEFVEYLSKGDRNKKYLILNMKRVPFIDATGLHRLKDMINITYKEKRMIILVEMNDNVKRVVLENIDNEKFLFFDTLEKAIEFVNKFNI
ncbi:MAG: SulP family inorganic anion transporter [Spirochaetes bacterium]|nr:SulP family inorganic anion transporter [Spirochaetota bacterium]